MAKLRFQPRSTQLQSHQGFPLYKWACKNSFCGPRSEAWTKGLGRKCRTASFTMPVVIRGTIIYTLHIHIHSHQLNHNTSPIFQRCSLISEMCKYVSKNQWTLIDPVSQESECLRSVSPWGGYEPLSPKTSSDLRYKLGEGERLVPWMWSASHSNSQ